ncbi:4-hydroxybenzoate 3-monooxygenase [Virgisporangium aliadipatigenens]|uniref:4-hydroxybenzoate 3-monooxygenase n=1 Tax=Virgisporangium aliadipatigenens TaxID=741659 RepID=A0A8J4DRN0_9ACTN|nr:4-hydroxybenzoate 3-monooxygenase [Virgisporangium aliadipatigenens]GIJ48310.1 4-hydroxybenzoate 3-monooxygenase [Virgisporangium aliadipatigenens]
MTRVGVVGAGPAGLMLANVLAAHGIDCVVFERASRAHIERRARAGLIEHRAIRALDEYGLAGRLLRTGVRHGACEFRLAGRRHTARYSELTGGRAHYVYPQQELVKDLVAAFLGHGGEIRFDTPVTGIRDLDAAPRIEWAGGGMSFDVVAGCDGAHGAAVRSVPAGALTVHEYRHGHGWLAVLAAAPPSTRDIIYALHPTGFAGHMLRSAEVSRYYLQCPAGDDVAHWPDARIWAELRRRLATDDGWCLREGPIIEKAVLDMRSRVCEPMRFGNLFLVGDAAHIVTPAGAKGMNLALGDAHELALGLVDRYAHGDDRRLNAYSATRLDVVWRAQEFTTSFLDLLHNAIGTGRSDTYSDRVRSAIVNQITGTGPRAQDFAESYVG